METVAEIGYEEQAGRGKERGRGKKKRVEVVQEGKCLPLGAACKGCVFVCGLAPKDKRGMQKCCTAVVANVCVCVHVFRQAT